MPRNLPGPEWEGEEFRRSPAYADYTAALAAAGCASYRDLIALPLERQRAFHEDWTARMQARVGLDPREQASASQLALVPRLDTSPRDPVVRAEREALVRRLVAQGESNAAIARVLGVTFQRVQQLRRKYGIAPARATRPSKDYRYGWYKLTPAQREARAEALRLREDAGLEFAAIGERLGVDTATAWKWVRDERARVWHHQHAA